MGNKKKKDRLKSVKGMHDMLPPDSRRLREVERVSHEIMQRYGYSEARTPILEYTPLFARSIGDQTDIVEKEMYTFTDRDDSSLTMRPEGTASVVRAYVQHALHKTEQMTRWYYFGPMFRHERAQRGRYRQFYQLGVEALGTAKPAVDAEMIAMLTHLLGDLGLDSLRVHLNTLGCPVCRPDYRQALLNYLSPREGELCEDCKRRFNNNPLRVLDCKVEGCQAVADGAPLSLDHTCADCRDHWDGLMGDLSLLEVEVRVDNRLVRGLDYYTRTTFELISDSGDLGSQNTVAGGGRYDGLVEELGGPSIPAVGFAMGLERLLLALGPDRPPLPPVAHVAMVSRGDKARAAVVPLAARLRRGGLAVDIDHRGGSMKSQMKRANKLGAPAVLILGEDELDRGTATLRRMADSTQEEVNQDQLEAKLREVLE